MKLLTTQSRAPERHLILWSCVCLPLAPQSTNKFRGWVPHCNASALEFGAVTGGAEGIAGLAAHSGRADRVAPGLLPFPGSREHVVCSVNQGRASVERREKTNPV